ncbi:hypothetical protein PABG_06251 [Paracoccidioides brasiliensis Pb03]|uniref:Uncharacterized protein n=1 Tax=Paracoccidioides brasiliensis (strain Pb18) TaxID=502780 RepID=C1GKC6_PARBD|nr:uncharacterized protein PADG_07712 [Paracoccidioides brasiliensis Pb18]EEH16164.2 hypothetical protein PABG_06251 [Paracoccidioides brasiliensis Pb03]EEH42892.2 hypothetical protein PADG_07712 [Paracoccidioides brasiliensis Pb18]ODH53678.1 hypothetical protein GX48_00096 [Paracoccidioides brasiliensis]
MARQQSLDSQRPIMAPSVWFPQISFRYYNSSLRSSKGSSLPPSSTPAATSATTTTTTAPPPRPSQPRNKHTKPPNLPPGKKQVSSHHSSQRFSAISGTGSLAPSDHTISSTMTGDSRLAEIKELGAGLERLENKPLTQQRFVPTPEKTDDLNKLALGAKVERALGRRMSGQDAVMRKRTPTEEKQAIKMEAAS